MKITSKLIEEVVSEVAGEDVIPLIRILKDKSNVSEFKLAEEIKAEVNLTRNMLYRLYDYNLVSFIRRKDKRKGWYIYYWTFDKKKILHLAIKVKKERLEHLHERLKREETGQFFTCQNECMRLNFEQAMNFEFKCPECGELMNQKDNSHIKEEINKKIKEIEKELEAEMKSSTKIVKKSTPPTTKKKVVKKKIVKKVTKKKVVKKLVKKKVVKKVTKKKVTKKKVIKKKAVKKIVKKKVTKKKR